MFPGTQTPGPRKLLGAITTDPTQRLYHRERGSLARWAPEVCAVARAGGIDVGGC